MMSSGLQDRGVQGSSLVTGNYVPLIGCRSLHFESSTSRVRRDGNRSHLGMITLLIIVGIALIIVFYLSENILIAKDRSRMYSWTFYKWKRFELQLLPTSCFELSRGLTV